MNRILDLNRRKRSSQRESEPLSISSVASCSKWSGQFLQLVSRLMGTGGNGVRRENVGNSQFPPLPPVQNNRVHSRSWSHASWEQEKTVFAERLSAYLHFLRCLLFKMVRSIPAVEVAKTAQWTLFFARETTASITGTRTSATTNSTSSAFPPSACSSAAGCRISFACCT